jgi:predicted nucleic acid-binding protein
LPSIADNDLWIAACATANGLPLATLNRRHFEPLTIFGLTLLSPSPRHSPSA